MLVHVTAFKGWHKIQNRWENREYVVEWKPYPNLPVYVVCPRDGEGHSWTLHRNYLLPISWCEEVPFQWVLLPLWTEEWIGRAPCSDVPPLGLGTRGSEAIVLDSWAVRLKTMAVVTCLCLYGRGRPTDADGSGWVMAPLKRLYKPSASDTATANSICWRPSASRHRQSTCCHRKLAQCRWCNPEKNRKTR